MAAKQTKREQVRKFRDSWVRETGEPMSLAVAAVLMDRQADAQVHRERQDSWFVN